MASSGQSTKSDRRTIAELEGKVEKSQRFNYLLGGGFFCLALVVLMFLFLPLPDHGADPATVPWIQSLSNPRLSPEALLELRTVLGGGLITFFVFSLGLQVFNRSDETARQGRAMFYAIVDNEGIVDELSNDAKRTLVTNSLESILPKEIGTAVSEGVVLPLVDDDVPYRKQYIYRVEALEPAEYPTTKDETLADMFPVDRYRWMRERIQYQPYFPEENRVHSGEYTIVLAFNKTALNSLFNDHSIFFRAMVELDEPEISAIFEMDEDAIESFVRDAIQFRAKDGGKGGEEVQDGIKVVKAAVPASTATGEPERPIIRITVPRSKQRALENRLIEVSMRFPYLRAARHFTFTLPQPCEKPEFEFFPSSDMDRIEGIYYMSMIKEDRLKVDQDESDGRTRSVEVKVTSGWVFPTSGVTFTWSDNAKEGS